MASKKTNDIMKALNIGMKPKEVAEMMGIPIYHVYNAKSRYLAKAKAAPKKKRKPAQKPVEVETFPPTRPSIWQRIKALFA